MKRLIILLCLLGLAALPSCGLFGDKEDSQPDVALSQMDTDIPDEKDPDRED
ncbi:hypothetical protein [Algoriphagus jejuensis]|uniref:hypothetical protein n=1 Tax=Algoriphagus jejuensis TaxID=419934 RepID=UPI0031DF564E